MKIKSSLASLAFGVCVLVAPPSDAQVPNLPIGVVSGMLDVGSSGGLEALSGGLPAGGLVIPEFGGASGRLPFTAYFAALPGLPGMDELLAVPDATAVANLVPELTRSFGKNAGAVPGLIDLGSQLNPLQSGASLFSTGATLGGGAIFGSVPVLDVIANNPEDLVVYLLNNGSVISGFGVFENLPAIPLLTGPLNFGFGEDLPFFGEGLPSF